MTDRKATAANPARTADGEWVSTIAGDRVCARCGFNLLGQPIVREEKYGLFVARCPECAAVASLQEYPTMGRWARRLGALCIALWALAMLAGSFAFGGVLTGFTMLVVQAGAGPFAEVIQEGHRLWLIEQRGATSQNVYYSTAVSEAWWLQQDHAAMLAKAGGASRAFLAASGAAPAVAIPGFIFGVVISVAAMHRRGWRMALLTGVPIAIAAAFLSIIASPAGSSPGSRWATDIAIDTLETRLMPAALALAWLAMIIGALVGRPIVRWLVRLMLPPRLVTPLGSLWVCDGLAPPRPDGARRPPSA